MNDDTSAAMDTSNDSTIWGNRVDEWWARRNNNYIDLTNDTSVSTTPDELPQELDISARVDALVNDSEIIDLTDDDTVEDARDMAATAAIISLAITHNEETAKTNDTKMKPNDCPITPPGVLQPPVCPVHKCVNAYMELGRRAMWFCVHDKKFIEFSFRQKAEDDKQRMAADALASLCEPTPRNFQRGSTRSLHSV